MTDRYHLKVGIESQTMVLLDNGELLKSYIIATAKNGIGQIEGSECTPLGDHQISEKIGDGMPENAVFVAREWTQEIYTEALSLSHANRDWILTRIMWLDGLENGLNRGEYNTEDDELASNDSLVSCDTKGRYIYIHGCPDSHAMQVPSSHGCIKMRNADIIELFDLVAVGTPVLIAK
jgi:hypothetical protein